MKNEVELVELKQSRTKENYGNEDDRQESVGCTKYSYDGFDVFCEKNSNEEEMGSTTLR